MRLVFLVLALSYLTLAQSPDEEEAVHFEGSANAPSDDEDIQEGSGLPVEEQYATSPVMTKMTSTAPTTTTTTVRASTTTYARPTTLVRQQKITTYPSTTTTRITTRVSIDGDDTPISLFAQNGILIAMAVFVLLIFIVIVVIVCCCKKQKKGYTPAKQTLDT